MTDEQKLTEILNTAIVGVKKHRHKESEYDKGMFHAFQTIRNKWHELNDGKALPIADVVVHAATEERFEYFIVYKWFSEKEEGVGNINYETNRPIDIKLIRQLELRLNAQKYARTVVVDWKRF